MTFYKYHGTGNDFILIDNRNGKCQLTTIAIAKICNRHFGIGADGLMLLSHAEGYDFRMVYYNSDGSESTMCGNGGRCMVAFARSLGIIKDKARFVAIDGEHTASINNKGVVHLHMQDVTGMNILEGHTILNTGSPHYVAWVKEVKEVDVFAEGKRIRNRFQPKGINVNFTQVAKDRLLVRTYERGVEDETLSCGTGVVAAAIAATCSQTGDFNTTIDTPGGTLLVSFTKDKPNTAKK